MTLQEFKAKIVNSRHEKTEKYISDAFDRIAKMAGNVRVTQFVHDEFVIEVPQHADI